MEFYINQHATLNKLKLELIQDGRNDFHKFHEKIQDADIYFTMTDLSTGVKRISKRKADIELVEPSDDCVGEEYYVVYQFNSTETSKPGKYVGKFEIVFLDGSGTLIAPIRDTLYINILDQGILK